MVSPPPLARPAPQLDLMSLWVHAAFALNAGFVFVNMAMTARSGPFRGRHKGFRDVVVVNVVVLFMSLVVWAGLCTVPINGNADGYVGNGITTITNVDSDGLTTSFGGGCAAVLHVWHSSPFSAAGFVLALHMSGILRCISAYRAARRLRRSRNDVGESTSQPKPSQNTKPCNQAVAAALRQSGFFGRVLVAVVLSCVAMFVLAATSQKGTGSQQPSSSSSSMSSSSSSSSSTSSSWWAATVVDLFASVNPTIAFVVVWCGAWSSFLAWSTRALAPHGFHLHLHHWFSGLVFMAVPAMALAARLHTNSHHQRQHAPTTPTTGERDGGGDAAWWLLALLTRPPPVATDALLVLAEGVSGLGAGFFVEGAARWAVAPLWHRREWRAYKYISGH